MVFKLKIIFSLFLINMIYSQTTMRSFMTTTFEDFTNYRDQWIKEYIVCDGDFYYCRVKLSKSDYLSSITTSEAQAFGMLIFASLTQLTKGNFKKYYDGMLRFAERHPSSYEIKKNPNLMLNLHLEDSLLKNTTSFMSWYFHESFPDETYGSSFSADSDIAYSLFLANSLYFSSREVYYNEKFKFLIKKLSGLISLESYCPYLGDFVADDKNIDSPLKLAIKPSSFTFTNFLRFSSFAESNNIWDLITQRQLALLLTIQEDWNSNGLIPDYLQYLPESQSFTKLNENILEGADTNYYLNSCTLPWRLSNYIMKSNNPRALRVLYNILVFFIDKSIEDISGYLMDGTKFDESKINTNSMKLAFIAPLSTAAIIDYDALFINDKPGLKIFKDKQIKFLNSIEAYIKDNHQGYYQDTLVLLSMLTLLRRT